MKKIIVVDDDPDILEVVRSILLLEGYEVLGTGNGEAVFDLIATTQPDLLLMDIMIAGTDGREICRQLKNHAYFHPIPIILFSASNFKPEEIMVYGADDFLPKPFDIDRLLHKVAQQLHLNDSPQNR